MTTTHEHEEWQMRESASGGRYCAACGEREHGDLLITGAPDGKPSLEDLTALIAFCRLHTIPYLAIDTGNALVVTLREHRDPAEWFHFQIIEGKQHPHAFFLGTDGTVYDANREAL